MTVSEGSCHTHARSTVCSFFPLLGTSHSLHSEQVLALDNSAQQRKEYSANLIMQRKEKQRLLIEFYDQASPTYGKARTQVKVAIGLPEPEPSLTIYFIRNPEHKLH